jgi:molybdopterin-guanine dinucleotide biosynthesis adapter protein
LTVSMEAIISLPGMLAVCERCGEEISNQREVFQDGQIVCQTCAGNTYFTLAGRQATPGSSPVDRGTSETITKDRSGQPIPVVTVIGKSGNGKTVLMEKVVRELYRRGYRVATIKHHSHKGFNIDVPGKDSWRFAQAGSQHVVIVSPDKLASYRQLEKELNLDAIIPTIDQVDIILVEGFRDSNKPTIEVVRAENSRELVGSSQQRIAVATDIQLDLDVPQYDLNDYLGIVDLIERSFLLGEPANLSTGLYEFRSLGTASPKKAQPTQLQLINQDHKL